MEAHQLSYITENIDSFQFSDFLKEFDFRDKTYAEIRFKALIDYILQYKSTNNSQKIIDFATKVKSEKFQIFYTSTVLDYWEGVINTTIINTSRERDMEARIQNINKERKTTTDQVPDTAPSSTTTTILAIANLHPIFRNIIDEALDMYNSRLKYNNCLDISNESENAVMFHMDQNIVNNYKKNLDNKLPKLDDKFKKELKKNLKKCSQLSWMVSKNKMLESCLKTASYSNLFLFFYNILNTKDSFPQFYNHNSLIKCSEMDYIVNAWGPLFKEVFKNSSLMLYWGDTPINHSTAPFKVDLRIVCKINDIMFDLGCVEFSRHFKSNKAKRDRVKLILESKELLNIIYTTIGGDFNQSIKVCTIQIAGLKGHVITTKIEESKLYISQNTTNRFHYPIYTNDIYTEGTYTLQSLLSFKTNCVRLQNLLQKALAPVNPRQSFVSVLNNNDTPPTKRLKTATTTPKKNGLPVFCTPLNLENSTDEDYW